MNIKSTKLYRINGNTFIAADTIERALDIYDAKNSGFEHVPEVCSIERVTIDNALVLVLVENN